MSKQQTTLLSTSGQARYVAYYRVSTKKQGDSGLGLEAQKNAVVGYVKGVIVAEFLEVESGKKNQRQQLTLAIEESKKQNAILVIAKLDRLSRNASFIHSLRDSGVNFQCVDMPDANTLTVGIFATLAQHERELISGRTRAALKVKQEQGVKLGSPQNLTHDAQVKGVAGNSRKAVLNENNRRASAMIASLMKTKKTYAAVAEELNRTGFRTSRGCRFQAIQVQRLYMRVKLAKSTE